VATFTFGHFRLNVQTRQLWKGDDVVPLTAKAFDTLVVLVAHHGRVVSKEELMTAVWRDTVVTDDSLTQNIRLVRRALGDDAGEPQFITTVARRGYRFLPPVTEVPEATEPARPPSPSSGHTAAVRRGRSPWLIGGLGALVGAVGALIVVSVMRRPVAETPPPVFHFNVSPPPGTTLDAGSAVAPDARTLALVATDVASGRTGLWITDLLSGQSQAIPGTDGASRPFWSPDGSAVGFFTSGALKLAERGSGLVRTLAAVRGAAGGSWGPDGRVLFAGLRSPIAAVPASGGPVAAVTSLDASRQEIAHRWPQHLPDGRRFLYFVESAEPERTGTYVGAIGSSVKQRIIDVPAFYYEGRLVYVRDRVLQAQRLDLADYSLDGVPVTLATDVAPLEITTAASISAAGGRLLAYSGSSSIERLVWFDRSGMPIERIDAPPGLYNPSLARDGRQLLAASGTANAPRGIWQIDLERGAAMRLAFGMRPLASPDGRHIAFTDDRSTGVADVYLRPTAGRDSIELLLASRENKMVDDWSPDGRYLVIASTAPATNTDLWLLPTTGDRTPAPLLKTAANELHGRVSPDGRWLAYTSDETGSLEVYVQSIDEPALKRTVSVGGGSEPRWRGDGRELFYLGADLAMMAVDVSAGPTMQLGRPRRLFRVPIARGRSLYINHYDVSADGRRFVIVSAEQHKESALMVLLNWTSLTGE
jgi:DNA-binding winged helix-turn-helix (wHTH) protein/Tol biopolymer transport system component